jgi:hypothetical protein
MNIFTKDYWYKAPALLYVLGFIIHNTYLSQYQSSEFDLLQAKYIFTGFTFVAITAITLMVIFLRVNTAYIPSSYKPASLFPWLLRIACFVFFFHGIIFRGQTISFDEVSRSYENIEYIKFLISNFGQSLFTFFILDTMLAVTQGNDIGAKLSRSIIRIISIPFLICTVFYASLVQSFYGLLIFVMYFFIATSGWALNQYDKKHKYEVRLLDENIDKKTSEEHERNFLSLFMVATSIVLLISVINNYTKYIYPNISISYGGNKPIEATINTNNEVIYADIINESSKWVIYKTPDSNNVFKVKTDSVNDIEYIIKKSNNTLKRDAKQHAPLN